MYRYIKTFPKKNTSRITSAYSYVLMFIGIGIVVWVGGPIMSFWLFTTPYFSTITTPVPDVVAQANAIVDPQVQTTQIENGGTQLKIDYTNPNAWFPGRPQKKIISDVSLYSLSIPKLNITDAQVEVGGDDLARSLIHYGGTALPGEYGNTVIFGHSTLVQLYNPKVYKTIFSKLPALKKGDSIYIKSDGIQYRYVVEDMTVTKPGDLSPLEQQFDNAYITLITCVPPGTYLERLNVKARLQKI